MPSHDTGEDQDAQHVGPDAILTQEQFARALTLRRSQIGLTIRDVSRATGIPLSTLGGYFSGRHLPPMSQVAAFSALLTTLGVNEKELSRWQSLITRLRQLDGRRRTSSDGGPFRGLESYGIDDAPWYAGRERLVGELLAVHDELHASTGRPRVHVVVGASGSGKSSALRAGLMAHLRDRGLSVAAVAPGVDPLDALRKCLAECTGGRPHLLVVDQFEEIFSGEVDATARASFITEVGRLAEPKGTSGTLVFVALRADFYVDVLDDPMLLPWLADHQTAVGPMTDDELRAVITEPAGRAGIPVEAELVDLVLQDLSPHAGDRSVRALPLLSHALLETWKRSSGTALTVADYVGVGRIAGAVQRSAEAVYSELSPAAQEASRVLFSLLVSVDEEGIATRRRIERTSLSQTATVDEAVAAFVEQRILTISTDTVEISHEALLDAWPRLRDWIGADRDQLRLRRRLTQSALGWQEQGRDPDGLLRGNLLALVRELPESPGAGLPALERDFLDASIRRDQARVLADQRRRRRLNGLFASIAVLAVMALLLSLVLVVTVHRANDARHAANQARDEALSRQVAIQADRLRSSDPALATQLSLAAYGISPTVEARSSILDAAGSPLCTRIVGPDGFERAVASPTGHTIAVAGADGKIRFYRRTTDSTVPTLSATLPVGKGGTLFAAAFSPDGRLFAAGGSDGTVTVFDMADPAHPEPWHHELTGPTSTVYGLAFSPDNRQLVAATNDPALFRWRIGRASATRIDRTKLAAVPESVAISPSGLIATGNEDGSVALWRARRRGLRLSAQLAAGQSSNVVYAVTFSPDGRLLAAGSKDSLVRVWKVSGTPKPATKPLTGPASWVNAIAFNPSGTALAAGASGASIQVWNTRDWSLRTSFPGTANFTSVQFLAGDGQLLSGAIDGVTRIWSLVSPRLPAFKDSLWAVSYTKNGSRMYVAVGTDDPSVVELNSSDPMHPRPTGNVFRGPSSAGLLAAVAAVKPDGSQLASGTTTGNIVIWKVGGNHQTRPVGILHAAGELVENVTYSRDGSLLAATSDDGTVSVYDTTGPGLPRLVHKLDANTLALGVDISPDDRLLAVTGNDYKIHWWRITPGKATALSDITGFTNYSYAVQFSPDGRTLAGGSADRTVRLWNITDLDHPRLIGRPLRGPTNTVFSIAFSPDGRLLAGASQDGAVWVWKRGSATRTPALYAKLDSVGTPLYSVHSDPATGGFAAVGASGQADYWPMAVTSTARTLCASIGTPINRQEWSQYVAGATYRAPCPTS